MRKIALKKKNPDRHKIIKTLRTKDTLQEIVTKRGKSIALNVSKHFLYNKPYINQEYQQEMLRKLKRLNQKEEESVDE
tara:strand:- start:3921 stop:4154 length:234 start_codon:yes stop_codon:yes gene_type:complete